MWAGRRLPQEGRVHVPLGGIGDLRRLDVSALHQANCGAHRHQLPGQGFDLLALRPGGRLVIEIGLCPVKPAEFVIFRISQWAGPGA